MSRSEWSSPKTHSLWGTDPLTLKLVDLGLCLIILVAPFFMGGRQAFGQVVLCGLACFTATLWAIHQWMAPKATWKFSGAELFILAGIGLIAFQCWPISHEMLHSISPKLQKLLPLWSPEHEVLLRAGTWNTISVTPSDTISDLMMVITCVLIFFVGVQRVRTSADVGKLLTAIALSGTAMATFGIAQFLLGNGKFFWFYENPFTDTRFVAKGAFTNANHFANFLAMTIPIQLAFLLSGQNAGTHSRKTNSSLHSSKFEFRDSNGLWAISLAITGVAVLLSMSRGGIVFSLAGVLLTLFLFWRKSLLSAGITMLVMALSVASLSATLMFGDLAIKMIEQNFHELTSTDFNQLDQSNARRNIWEANIAGIKEFPLFGTGLGSHHEVYWLWFNHPQNGTEYTHAESGFLQIALETGLTGFGIVMLLWLLILSWCLRGIWRQTSPENAATVCAISAALLVNFIHSLTDFVWYAPACMVITLLLAACASKLSSTHLLEHATKAPEERTLFSFSRLSWGCCIPLTLMLSVWMADYKLAEAAAEPVWFESIRLAQEIYGRTHDDIELREKLERRRIRFVLQAAKHNPRDQRIQTQAGLACLSLFEYQQREVDNQMPLTQIRDAALSAFEDSTSMNDWLNKPGVMGESRVFLDAARHHFRQSLKLCPLQSQPYLQLAELVWLEGIPIDRDAEFVQQAVLARPYNARARFAMGHMYWLAGDEKQGIEHWQEAFRLDPLYRGQLISILSSYIPASFFLENFDADLESLRQLKIAYKSTEDQQGYRVILQQLAMMNAREAVKSKSLNVEENWLEAHTCFDALGNQRAAYEALKEALAVNPSSYKAHLTFAIWTYDHGIYKEAYEHLSWCHRRKPDIKWLETLAGRALIGTQGGVVPVSHQSERDESQLVR